jgi:ABC-2 type transport system ATP-binding protein
MLLETEQLTKDYGRHRALADLNLRIGPGEIYGLLGPNGSGKSTALRLLLGFLRPTAGGARIAGHDCWSDSVAVRRRVAYLPGELRLYENMTGRKLLGFLAGLRGQRLGAECDRLARRFDIDLDRRLTRMSSGMKRKVALMHVLLPDTPLLILDEPTNTLDPIMRDALLEQLLAAKSRGQAVLFSSHVLQEVEKVCDRVGILHKGRLVHEQEMQSLQTGRLARVRFSAPPQPPVHLDGVVCQFLSPHDLRIECHGPLSPLLEWLARQPVSDVRIEAIGLAAVYQRYHFEEQT